MWEGGGGELQITFNFTHDAVSINLFVSINFNLNFFHSFHPALFCLWSHVEFRLRPIVSILNVNPVWYYFTFSHIRREKYLMGQKIDVYFLRTYSFWCPLSTKKWFLAWRLTSVICAVPYNPNASNNFNHIFLYGHILTTCFE